MNILSCHCGLDNSMSRKITGIRNMDRDLFKINANYAKPENRERKERQAIIESNR